MCFFKYHINSFNLQTDKRVKIFPFASGGTASHPRELPTSRRGLDQGINTKPRETSALKIKPTCGLSDLRPEGPQFSVVVPLLSAPVELSCFNLAAPRKGNPCVAFGHHLLRWPGDSGHGGEVPGSWHGRAAKPALGKCWQPAEQPRYKLGPISHQVLLPGQAAPPGPWPSPVPLLALAQGRSSPGRQRLPDHVRSGGGFAPQSPAEDTAAEISSLG